MAVTFACEKFVYGLEAIEAYIKMKIPVEWAGDDMFAEDQSSDEFIRNYLRESKQIRIVSEHDDKKSDRGKPERKGKERAAASARPVKKDHKNAPARKDERTPFKKDEKSAEFKKALPVQNQNPFLLKVLITKITKITGKKRIRQMQ